MCVYSMIIDRFQPDFAPWIIPGTGPLPPATPIVDPDALAKLIEAFKASTEAAKVVDKALGAPDCEDPEKAKLVERVAELEKMLKDTLGVFILKDREWYLSPSGAYTNLRSGARRFETKTAAKAHAETLLPIPRVVKIVRNA